LLTPDSSYTVDKTCLYAVEYSNRWLMLPLVAER